MRTSGPLLWLIAVGLLALPVASAAAVEPDLAPDVDDELETAQGEYQVCLYVNHQYECYAVIWLPDVPPICYYDGPPPHGNKMCLN